MKVIKVDTSSSSSYYELNNTWNGTAVSSDQGSHCNGKPLPSKSDWRRITVCHRVNSNGYGETQMYVPKNAHVFGYWGDIYEMVEPDEDQVKLIPILNALFGGSMNTQNLMGLMEQTFPDIWEDGFTMKSRFNLLTEVFAKVSELGQTSVQAPGVTEDNAVFLLAWLIAVNGNGWDKEWRGKVAMKIGSINLNQRTPRGFGFIDLHRLYRSSLGNIYLNALLFNQTDGQ